MQIELQNVWGGANCQSALYSSKEGFLPISYTFSSGNIYGVVSDFGLGSWALASCVGGRGDCLEGEIFLNRQKINPEALQKYSCFIGEKIFDPINTKDHLLSAKECIEKALFISKIPYTVQEIKDLFELSDERFERDLNNVSGEIYRISAAIGFAMNKEIFCYPWFNTRDIAVHISINIIKKLKTLNKIILFPTCRASVKYPIRKEFDHVINLHNYFSTYYNLRLTERIKMKMKKSGW